MNRAEPAPPSVTDLLAGHTPASAGYDELAGPDGQPRPHWRPLLAAWERMDRAEFVARQDSARRILRENGATYNTHGDTQDLDRPWALDLVPLPIPHCEWQIIEAGLVQRARLLNLLLADFYGPRQLVADGLLPAPLLFANPAFLRPCQGLRPAEDSFLFTHAVDLARSADGRWWVLADRTQAPGGAGYALENRLVLSRVLGDEFRNCHVQRLGEFFDEMRDSLRRLAPQPRGQPSVVLLTPGPFHDSHFEQAMLARYLGFTLVEGGDLTVRDRRVFIKTLEGLQGVDVILRRVNDDFCDPLELRADSHLGVAGLLDAARAGNVAIANAPGSGVVETPALMAFLPSLCRRLLGEELLLPSVATWWCGQAAEREFVLRQLDRLVVRRAFPQLAGAAPLPGATPKDQAALRAAIEATPWEFVAQEPAAFSTAPVWGQGAFERQPVVLRAYACASGRSYRVLPGGLARFSGDPERLVSALQSDGGSKDTWVLAEGSEPQFPLLPAAAKLVHLDRSAGELPSRVADNLFWLGRYVERLEDTVRVLRCLLNRLTGEAGVGETPSVRALVRLLVALELFPPEFSRGGSLASVEREAYSLLYQVHRLGTVREVLGRLRNLAFVLRDRFSADTWRILRELQVDARPKPGRTMVTEALALLNNLISGLAAFSGMEMENMTRGHGWRFLDLGRRLERAANIATLLQGALSVEAAGADVLEPVLEIADSVMTYRRRYFAQPHLAPVLEVLLTDDSNPRALAFQLQAIAAHVANLPREAGTGAPEREAQQIAALIGQLASADPVALVEAHRSGTGPDLAVQLGAMVAELPELSDAITHRYFSHARSRAN